MAVTRYVKSTGTTTGAFTKNTAPARTVSAALKAAGVGDIIEILDAAIYREPELVLDKPITITSTYLVLNPTADPTAVGFNTKLLPTIAAKRSHRVIRIQGTPSTRTTLGAITLRGLIIRKGHSTHTSKDPGIGCGGGVVVIDADQAVIDRCVFIDNRTTAAPVQGWPEADRLALRQGVLGFLGDIFTPGVERAINKLIDTANMINSFARVSPLARISRTNVLAEVGKSFDSKVVPGRTNSPISGQAFGGGLATVWSSPTVSNCVFSNNKANGRGGAVAVTGYGWPVFNSCVVKGNQTLSHGRCDGGGIGCEVAVPTKLGRDLYEVDLVRFLVSKLGVVRAAIGTPFLLTLLSPSDLLSGASTTARGIKAIVLDAIHGQWSKLSDHSLYYLMSTALAMNAWDAWDRNEINAAKAKSITLNGCRISRNRSFDDGGGIYASVLSHVVLKATEISNNTAENMGGGARLSMGSSAVLEKCVIKGNAAGPGGVRGHDKGGGLAARNVDLHITDTIFGAAMTGNISAPVAESNTSGDAPGGGVAFESSSEGALAGVPDLWSSILVEVFGVRAVDVSLGKGCKLGSNAAGFNSTKRKISAPQYAKGGGLFIVRGDFPDAPKLTLTVASAKTAIAGNLALTRGYISRAQRGLKVASANEVSLQDLIAHKEYTENNWGALINSSGTLKF